MKIRYYLMAFLLPFVTLLTHAAITGVSPMTTLNNMATAMAEAVADPLPLQGPGLGNLTYTSAELFKPVSMITSAAHPLDPAHSSAYESREVPATYPGRKDYGMNAGIMVNGYFLTSFAPDSGLGPGGFLLYDISNPRQIKLVKKIYEPEGRTQEFRETHSFGTAKIGGKTYVVLPSINGVEFWDFTDVNDIKQVKKLALPGVNGGDYENVAWQLWWQAPYLYVASAGRGIFIVDATDPANAVVANRGAGKPNPVPTGELGGFRIGPIFTMGNHMVLTSMDNTAGFSSLDISDPLNPKVLDTVGSNPNYYATCFDGKTLHASARGGGAKMYSYDLSDRANFVAEDNRLVIDEQLYCATQDHYVIQGAQTYIHKVDVSNPLNHVEVGRGSILREDDPNFSHSDNGQVAAFGNLIFVGNDHGSGSGFVVHQVEPDTTKPEVKQVSPASNAKQQALTSRIGLGMSDSIRPESVNSNTFIVRPVGGNTLAGTYSVQLGIINFHPAVPLSPGTSYEVFLPANGVKDYAGNAIAADYKSVFHTGNAAEIGLMHYWSLTGNLSDQIGANNGTPATGDAFESIGLNFANRTAGVPLKSDTVATVLGGSASLSFYMKTTQAGGPNSWTAPGIFGRDQSGGADDVFWGWLDNSGRIKLSVGNDAGTTSTAAVNDGTWHHVVMTRDAASGAQAVYVDGVKTTSTGSTGNKGLSNKFAVLGQIQGNTALFKGTLAEVRVYGRVLSDTDVSTLRGQAIIGDPGIGGGPKLVNGQLTFNPATLGSSGAQYRWNFGDGTQTAYSNQANYSYTYTRPGHFTVTLTVKDANGRETFYTYNLTVIMPVTATAPRHTTNIAGDANSVYSVNPDSGTVAAIDAQSLVKRWEVRVGDEPKTLAIGPDGRIWVTVQGEDKLVALNAADGSLSATVPLAYGSGPYGVAFTPNGSKGLLTLESKSVLMSFDPSNGATTGAVALDGALRGIAIESGSQVAYVTRFKSKMTGGQLHKVNLQSMSAMSTIALPVDTTTVDTESRARGVANYLSQVVISPDGARAVLPSKKDNIVRGKYRDGNNLVHDQTVRSILSQVNLQTAAEEFGEQIDFDDRAPARAALFSPSGDYLFVAQMEGNRVAIVDPYSRAVRGEINASSAPHGLYLDATRKRLFVNNFLARSVSVHDVATVLSSETNVPTFLQTVSTVAAEPMSPAALRGKQVFYNASDRRMSKDNYISCASCHADGGDDGMVWDFTQRGEGLRRTISLQGRRGMGHGKLHWTANFDELQDFENDIRNEFGGTGFLTNADFAATSDPLGAPKAGKNAQLDDLAAYLTSLNKFMRSPARAADGSLSVDAARGQTVFNTAQCATCHTGATFRDGIRHDVGTIQASSGKGMNQPLAGVGFDTPTLLGTWNTTAFFHNGQAATLQDVLNSGHGNASSLPGNDVVALREYVRSLDNDPTPVVTRIRSNHSNLCVNVKGAATTSGTTVVQWPCGNAGNERFTVTQLGGGFVQFKAEHSGLCLAQSGTATTNAAVVQLACSAGDTTQWSLVGAALRNRASGSCLDVPNNATAQDTALITWTCNGGNNQNWTQLP
ncbi:MULTISPECIES: RICIN domain-containing protein [unclassified Variovorax]|jgi:PKD repeat protein|uniref:RICIN domain-containing protein n=1 Tax=unclassified Variovorax TaxID=663243 RepID=UPI000F7EAFE9|nr:MULTISPECIES: RICIN domain-containing protein [unclassified Variovorax]RSZ42473.1 PKD domain-containing protein [Variovorax sp. 553]RSZ43447.1 PKD domain-containing protein [Variovorax sp. 679]